MLVKETVLNKTSANLLVSAKNNDHYFIQYP